ncbi:MAG: PaaI family thioesterase [Sporomusaceae bacterium]|jgi:uncharacterized protein (TIGR00369 family)|nr:PaaI family thioesterase [Sporomusaceae bacterium]
MENEIARNGQAKDTWCFMCGKDNPIGLKLEFEEQDGEYFSAFTARREHQGYDGIVHGGIVSALLDEIMARYIYAKGYNAVTARLEVRYHQPTPILEELTLVSRIVNKRGNIYELNGEIKLADGTVTAAGKAKIAVIGESEDERKTL